MAPCSILVPLEARSTMVVVGRGFGVDAGIALVKGTPRDNCATAVVCEDVRIVSDSELHCTWPKARELRCVYL